MHLGLYLLVHRRNPCRSLLWSPIVLMFTLLTSTFVDTIRAAFVVQNILDIVVITSLIYGIIVLFRKTKSLPIIIGVLLLTALYGISTLLNLPLTQTVFQAFFSMFLVILAIVFQRELRRFFELVGVLGIKRTMLPATDSTIKLIAAMTKRFSETRTGTLIVFPGRENVDRFLEGGVILNGKVSEALLLSLFDESTPGHDGAIVIDGDKVKKFSVHLPLAENIEAVKKFGTRHRAALGLSESCDALTLVVSEERGTISIGRNKQLRALRADEDLERLLRDFYEEKFPKKHISNYTRWFQQNFTTLLTAFGIAFVIWAFFTSQTSITQRKFVVPIEFTNAPKEYVISESVPEEVVVTFSRRSNELSTLTPGDLKASADVSGMKPGWHRVIIHKEDIKHPSNIDIAKTDPESIQIKITKAQ